MFTNNPVAPIIALQLAVAFYVLVWPALRRGFERLGHRFARLVDDPEPVAEQTYSYRGRWRDAGDQRAKQSSRSQAPPRRTVNAEKARHLATLGLGAGADQGDVKSAYRKLAKRYHPDRQQSTTQTQAQRDQAQARMQQLNEAYDWLQANA